MLRDTTFVLLKMIRSCWKNLRPFFYLKQTKKRNDAQRYAYLRMTVDGKYTELSTNDYGYYQNKM